MPTMVPLETHEWLQDRQSDLMKAMSSREMRKVLELTLMQASAAEKLMKIVLPVKLRDLMGPKRLELLSDRTGSLFW